MNGRLSTTSSTSISAVSVGTRLNMAHPAGFLRLLQSRQDTVGEAFGPCAQRDYQQWGIAISSALSCLSVWCVIGSSAAGSRLRQHERARRFSGCTRSTKCMAFITIVVTVVVMALMA